MDVACTYCGSDLADHDPIFVEEQEGETRLPAGAFCNYSCLAHFIDDNNLEQGTACHIDVG